MDLKKILPIAIIGVAVLALVIYAAVSGQQKPSSNPNTTQPPSSSNPAPPAPAPATFDPSKTVSSAEPATVVPEGTDLKQYCEKYYTAWKNSDWKTAFEMQPISKKQQGNADSLAQQLQGYGMVGYNVGEPQIDKNVGTVVVSLDLGPNGTNWVTNWTFVKNDKGLWTVQASKTGMAQQ